MWNSHKRRIFGLKIDLVRYAKCMQMKSAKAYEKTTTYAFLGLVQKGNIEFLQYRSGEEVVLHLWNL